jgi:hypothetical protein
VTEEVTGDDTAPTLRPAVPGRNGGTLRPFRPGESGNPAGGALPKLRLTAALADVLEERGGPRVLAETLLDVATDRDHKAVVPALREVYERLSPSGADTITREWFAAFIGRLMALLKAELSEADAERIGIGIRDMLDGARTVQAEVRPSDE